MLDCLQLVHCHPGSQLQDIRRVKDAINELAHVYAELKLMGAGLQYIDVGGGLGVDYDGSGTNFASSMNYTLNEYANDVVYRIANVCNTRKIPHPMIVSESGRAVAAHHNRPGLRNLLRRHYRWGYTAVEAKSQSGAARLAWLYRYPWLLILGSPALVVAHTALILICWIRAGVLEPLWMAPAILASRVTYVAGLCVGAVRWMQSRDRAQAERPRPRWQ